ncbi:hypothetical protein Poli38472_012171 [Pythium oligandrum]|uniref:Glutathione S-transferase n=1 Tax=Pythium oligandrum TaxID=41045 RepID=A0A8K1CQV0_PYTOL|nr:hypothetical protein Poli38472_012171 [Pythium oligandrum]|eukprot:TMW67055.1 hypothetical protein Poli38472_012171 [Pythium oligandrum]
MSQYPQLMLTYFNAAARADYIRLAFFIGNVPFEDYRMSRDKFPSVQSSFPYGQLPVLEVDGEVIAHSQGILRYAGRLTGMYPVNDPVAALKIDEIMGTMDEMVEKMGPSFEEQDPEKKKALREELATVTFPQYFRRYHERLTKMKEYPLFQTDALFIHELVIFNFVRWMRLGVLDHIPATVCDGFESVDALMVKVENHPKVKEYYANPRNVPAKLKLTYIDGPGRAEPIRLAFHIGGVEFEDERIGGAVLKERVASLPYGQIPVLSVNGEAHAQSLQILRYAGTVSGLYPATDFKKALRIDEVLCHLDDISNAHSLTSRMEPEKQTAARAALVEETFPNAFKALDKRIAGWGGPYTVGDELTIADLAIYGSLLTLKTGYMAGIPATLSDSYSNLTRVYEQVAQHPKVQEWTAAHPDEKDDN